MFGKAPVFGRKQPTSIPMPRPDDDGVLRAIPKSVFEGSSGAFLKGLGFRADDPSNLFPTPDLVQARHDAAFAERTKFITAINADLPSGCSVAPYAMLPWSLWSGRHGRLLMGACHYYPTQPWNTLLLAEDDMSSAVLGLPCHPGCYPPVLETAADQILSECREDLDKAHVRADQALQNGDAGLSDFGDTLDRIKQRLVATAHGLTEIRFGEDVYNRHLKLFGKALGWSFAEDLLRKKAAG